MTDTIEANINAHSRPSELRISDMRVVSGVARTPLSAKPGRMRSTIIRLDTNQGISGYGEVRDGGSATYALMLKSRLLGENPCNIDRIFRKIKQFGHHGRQAGGVCGIEMALMDLAGFGWNFGNEEDRRYGAGARCGDGAAHGYAANCSAGGGALCGGDGKLYGAGKPHGRPVRAVVEFGRGVARAADRGWLYQSAGRAGFGFYRFERRGLERVYRRDEFRAIRADDGVGRRAGAR